MGQDINKEIKDFKEWNENESRAYINLRDTVKAVLRGKSIALGTYIKTNKDIIVVT